MDFEMCSVPWDNGKAVCNIARFRGFGDRTQFFSPSSNHVAYEDEGFDSEDCIEDEAVGTCANLSQEL